MSNGFTGIQSAHFDAYEERKWASNRFNLERMRSRELLEGMCRDVVESLQEQGAAVRWMSTPDHPSVFNNHRVDTQLVMVLRSEVEQRRMQLLLDRATSVAEKLNDPLPHHQQAVVYLRMDHQRFEVACRLHTHAHLDRENLARRLAQEGEKEKLRELLVALPAGVRVSVVPQELMPSAECTSGHMEQLRAFVDAGHDWVVGQFFERGDEQITTTEFATVVSDLIRALWPIYQFVAWSSESDFVDGQAYLDERSKGADSETVKADTEAAAPPSPVPSEAVATSSKQSRSYRPDWQAPAAKPERQKGPMGPSAKARLRKQEEAQRRMELERQRAEQEARERSNRPPREDRPREDRPRQGGERPQRSNDGRRHGQQKRHPGSKHDPSRRSKRPDRGRPGGDKRRKPPKVVRWVDAEGDIVLMDHARISGGLFNGKVGQVVEIGKKGRLKVAIGDMAFDVEPSQATRVQPE